MTINLLTDDWISVRRQKGQRERIAPWRLTEDHDNNPIIALDTPRPDFNGALAQFLVGLLQTAYAPADHAAWVRLIEIPPPPEALREAFAPYEAAFELAGDGARFMQDFEDLADKYTDIGALLIEAPGKKTLRENRDHFIKRGWVEALCPVCAATALFTLQSNAPEGGAGHRTSLRGGGPLTTLALLEPKSLGLSPSLWRDLWLNVLEQGTVEEGLTGNPDKNQLSDIFPWLAPTRSSEAKTGQGTYSDDAHPLQMYWGMPRRIRLDWDQRIEGACDICGRDEEPLLTRYVTKNYGINYEGAWQHPLSPYSQGKEGELIPLHPQPGGIGYRYWLSYIADGEQSFPARVIGEVRHRLGGRIASRLWAFGYDMDSMKARGWHEAEFPLYELEPGLQAAFAERVQALTEAATLVSLYLRSGVKEAWIKFTGEARGDADFLIDEFFGRTQTAFFATLERLKKDLEAGEDTVGHLRKWHGVLRKNALIIFDFWVRPDELAYTDPRRVVSARDKLFRALSSGKLAKLLQLPKQAKKAKGTKSDKKEAKA